MKMTGTQIGAALVLLIALASAGLTAQVKSLPPAGLKSSRAQLVRTTIEIRELRRVGEFDYVARLDVGSDNKELQTLIFVQDLQSERFGLAVDRTGKGNPPGFPYVSGSGPGGMEWTSTFSSVWKHPSIRVFAVVAVIGENARWDRAKEFDSLRYLPFAQATKIEDVLRMLGDFRWRPQGYTFLDAPK